MSITDAMLAVPFAVWVLIVAVGVLFALALVAVTQTEDRAAPMQPPGRATRRGRAGLTQHSPARPPRRCVR